MQKIINSIKCFLTGLKMTVEMGLKTSEWTWVSGHDYVCLAFDNVDLRCSKCGKISEGDKI